MAAPTIRGPKIPLAWSTIKTTGYVVEKHDDDQSVDQVLLEDEDSQYCTEVTGLRAKSDVTIEVTPLAGLANPPTPGILFTYGGKTISILTIKKARAKGGAAKWTITGNNCPDIHGA